jgi:hypothetical protein
MATIQFEPELSEAQAVAQTFFTRMNRADRLGMPLPTQRQFHTQWAATTTVQERLRVCHALHRRLLALGEEYPS